MNQNVLWVSKLRFSFLIIVIAVVSSILITFFPVHAEGFYIPASSRTDMVYDDVRHLVYITNGDSLLRYDLSSASFLLGVFHLLKTGSFGIV